MALAYALGAPASTAAGGDQGDDQLGKGCVLRPLYAGDARQRPRWQETAVECYRRSGRVWWAWLDLNQRPHPESKMPEGRRHLALGGHAGSMGSRVTLWPSRSSWRTS